MIKSNRINSEREHTERKKKCIKFIIYTILEDYK